MTAREDEIRKNVKVFSRLSPSEKIRFVERTKKRLKYYRKMKFEKDIEAEDVSCNRNR